MTPQQLMDLPYAGHAIIALKQQGNWDDPCETKLQLIAKLKKLAEMTENTADALEALK